MKLQQVSLILYGIILGTTCNHACLAYNHAAHKPKNVDEFAEVVWKAFISRSDDKLRELSLEDGYVQIMYEYLTSNNHIKHVSNQSTQPTEFLLEKQQIYKDSYQRLVDQMYMMSDNLAAKIDLSSLNIDSAKIENSGPGTTYQELRIYLSNKGKNSVELLAQVLSYDNEYRLIYLLNLINHDGLDLIAEEFWNGIASLEDNVETIESFIQSSMQSKAIVEERKKLLIKTRFETSGKTYKLSDPDIQRFLYYGVDLSSVAEMVVNMIEDVAYEDKKLARKYSYPFRNPEVKYQVIGADFDLENSIILWIEYLDEYGDKAYLEVNTAFWNGKYYLLSFGAD